jgi:hypothetical protein
MKEKIEASASPQADLCCGLAQLTVAANSSHSRGVADLLV